MKEIKVLLGGDDGGAVVIGLVVGHSANNIFFYNSSKTI